jgi:hypothetical protein
MDLVAIAMMAGATGTTTVRVTGIGIGIGTGIAEAGGTADSIAPTLRDLRRLTDAKTATPYKTVSANHTGATKGIIVRAISPPLAIRPSGAALGSRTFHAGYPRLANQNAFDRGGWARLEMGSKGYQIQGSLCAWPLFAGAMEYKPQLA